MAHVIDDSNSTATSEWITLSCSLEALTSAARALGGSVRLHMHEDKAATKPLARDLLDRLRSCSHILSTGEATLLRLQNRSPCPVCLEDMQAGEEILCLPCDGEHAGHSSCLLPWLQNAPTCPTCRFEMPTQVSVSDLAEADVLIERSLAAVERMVATAGPPPPLESGAVQARKSTEAAEVLSGGRSLRGVPLATETVGEPSPLHLVSKVDFRDVSGNSTESDSSLPSMRSDSSALGRIDQGAGSRRQTGRLFLSGLTHRLHVVRPP